MTRAPQIGAAGRAGAFAPVAYLVAVLTATAVMLGVAQEGRAQFDTMPDPGYYIAVKEFYGGQYRDAERVFRRLTRTGVQANQARWIDSICYQAMLGEVLYQQGRNAEALAAFDQACLLLLSYPDFMRSVQFSDPRPEPNPTRAIAPWGNSSRRAQLGNYPQAMPIAVGSLTGARDAMQRGGTFLQPQFWRINATEVVRATALAIRRRNELLGPLGKHDRISKELAATLSRSNLSLPNHWSQAWTQLLSGVAKAGVGDPDEAKARLERSIVVGSGYDHPLTGVALLELGKLAMAAGDHKSAAQLLFDASVAGYAYDDLDVVTESLRLGWMNFLAGGGAVSGLYGPLVPAATWAQANRLWHVAATLRLAQAENLLRTSQAPAAATIIEDVGRRMGNMRDARLGLQQLFLQALMQISRGQVEPASNSLNRALAGQRLAALKNFQIMRATELYDARELTARVAPEVFQPLLADPWPADWTQRLFDTLAVASTQHGPAYDRWFLAAMDRKDVPQAIEVAERAKRARFLETLPLGGRLLALRGVLEAPQAELGNDGAIEKQQLLTNFPAYGPLAVAAAKLGEQIRSGSLQQEPGAAGQKLTAALDAWAKNVAAREDLLLAMALAPLPARQLFPPLRTTEELQESLTNGQALVIFHSAGNNLFGFLLTRQAEHSWRVGEVEPLRTELAEWLRSMGNYSSSRAMGSDELAGDGWRALGARLWTGLFADSRLDLARTTDLVIVPDSWLWYLPFEALVPPQEKPAKGATAGDPPLLVERLPIHFGPTAALAVGDRRPFRPVLHTGIVANDLAAAEKKAGNDASGSSLAELEDITPGPVRLVPPLAQAGHLFAPLFEQLVILDDIALNRNDVLGWSPLPRSRGQGADSLAAWMGLPYEGPERVVITGLPTAAETSLKVARRGDSAAAAPGTEIFQSVCGLMASGARTVLLSRWRTGGQMNRQLVREFVQELEQAPADEAWQRSLLLAWETPLDATQEPRLKRLAEGNEPPGANHPFFWAGYLLVDTGTVSHAPTDENVEVNQNVDVPDRNSNREVARQAATAEAAAGLPPRSAAARKANEGTQEESAQPEVTPSQGTGESRGEN